MSNESKPKLAKGGVVVSQEYYDSLSDVQKESGRFIVGRYAPLEAIVGATLLAKQAGFKGTSITAFVSEYLALQKDRQLGGA